jgi:pimeloyl-ACP methyl ester carboxylesterase
MAIPLYVTGIKVDELVEAATVSMLRKIETVPITLPPALASGPVPASFVRTAVSAGEAPPLVVIHGFDSSCLEFRRLMPELERRGIEAYALDVFGWSVTHALGRL